MIGTVLGVGIAHAYTHSLLAPWGSDYQTCTYKVQNTFGSLTKSQFADAMNHWNAQLTKSFLFKSSVDTQDTQASWNGVKTVTKYNYGAGFVARNIAYHPWLYSYTVESDIEFNTYYPFANSGLAGYYDVQSVMTHELGHTLSVNHSTNAIDRMYPDSFTGVERRVTTSDDRTAARDSTARWFN